LRWVAPVVALLLLTALTYGQGVSPAQSPGYLVAARANGGAQVEPYQPQPGDIVLYDDLSRLYHLMFRLARTQAPTHVAMVIARDDGSPALLDLLGPTVLRARVAIVDIGPRLHSYPGVIAVRRLRQPLTAEQSVALTQFATAQQGKQFAAKRVALLATPFCARVSLWRHSLGRTDFDRSRWFCSELVAAAAGAAHIVDPRECPANAVCPHDLACDGWLDLSRQYEPPVPWVADPRLVVQPMPGELIIIPAAGGAP
jgi:hypothetical protein